MTSAENREYLLRTVLGEAAQQPADGQAAVAHVILNRMNKRGAPDVRSIVTAKSQFEPWGSPEGRARMMGYKEGDPAYQQASQIVDGVLSGQIADPTGGADHFLNAEIVRQRTGGSLPSWANEMWDTRQQIGDHTFLGGSGSDNLQGGQDGDQIGGGSSFFDSYMSDDAPAAPEGQGGSAFFDSFMAETSAPKQEAASAETIGHDGIADGTARAITDGALMGFGDNLGAGLGAVLGADPESGEFFDYSRSMGERYDENLAIERQKRAAFAEEHPIIDTTAKVGGAVGSAVVGAAALPVKAAASTGGRVAQAAAGGGLLGGITGAGEADGPGESRLTGAAVGTGLGAGGGVLGIPVAAVASRVLKPFGKAAAAIFKRPESIDPATGKISEEAARRLQAIGVDPANVSKQLSDAFAAEAADATAPAVAARSLDIPLTKGQATGDIPQIANEEAMRAGARGQGAYNAMDEFGKRQAAAVGAARDSVVENPAGVTAVDAADVAIPAIRASADKAKAAAREAYDIFEASGGGVKGSSVKGLAGNIVQNLKREALDIDPSLTNANQSLSRLTKMFEGADAGSVPFTTIERARQMLRRANTAAIKGSNGADSEAMRVIMSTYDDWLEGAVDRAITDGSAESLDQVKKARGLWAEYLRTFTGKNGADNYIRKIIEDEVAPDQVAGWLFGASKNIGGGQSALLAKKLRNVLGADSAEFNALRQGAWDRLTMKADTPRGIDDMESALREFVAGKGKTLAAELFNPEELGRIKEFRAAISALRVPKKAGNPSGSGYEGARAVMGLARAAAAAVGLQTGGPGGAVAASMAPAAVAGFRNTLAAKAATKGISGPAPSLGGAVGIGGGAGGVGADRGIQELQGR